MSKRTNKYLLLLFLALFVNCTHTKEMQQGSYGRAARRHFENALRAKRLQDYPKAIEEVKKAINRAPGFAEAYLLKAEIHSETGQYQLSIEPYGKALQINPDVYPEARFFLAEAYQKTGEYKLAKEQYQQLLQEQKVSAELQVRALKNKESCIFALKALENPVDFEPVNLGANINTEFAEYSPALTADEQTLVFTRKLPVLDNQGQPTGRHQEDFFVSSLIDGNWSEATALGNPINTPGNEGAQTMLPDGRFIFFTACNRSDGLGSCDIYFSRRVGNNWSVPRNMGSPVNSSSWDSHPSISADGKTLYFSSARPGSIGPTDIWISTLDENGQFWTEPVNLGLVINTSGNEMSPFIHHDNQTLYFASDGHPGMGGLDIFFSRRDSLGKWSKPVNLGFPVNTHADEFALVVGASGINAYFASDMAGGFGQQDLYHFELNQEARPQAVTYMKGVVFDNETKERLQATFLLIDVESGEEIITSSSDRQTGEFLIAVPTGRELALNVSREGYIFFSENFNYIDTRTSAEPYLRDIPLLSIEEGKVAILRNVFFDTDSYHLKPESKVELDKLVEFLVQNPAINVEIGGHTDVVGSLEYNMELSRQRARAVVNYLVNAGINSERLSFEGYAFTKPIAPNETEEGRAQNRRTEFTIISK